MRSATTTTTAIAAAKAKAKLKIMAMGIEKKNPELTRIDTPRDRFRETLQYLGYFLVPSSRQEEKGYRSFWINLAMLGQVGWLVIAAMKIRFSDIFSPSRARNTRK